MTLIMGVRCGNGIVMGADTAATFLDGGGGPTIRNEAAHKIQIIEKKMIFALTGSTGMAGRIAPVLTDIWNGRVKLAAPPNGKPPTQPIIQETSPPEALDWIRRVLFDKVYGVESQAAGLAHNAGWRVAALEGQSSFMLALPFKGKGNARLYTFNAVGLPDEQTDDLFCNNIGSGQPIADPFMGFLRRVLWNNKPPTVEQATLGVVWGLDHAISLHPGGVGGVPEVATLEFDNGQGWIARRIEQDRLQEHRQDIKSMESLLRDWHVDEGKDAAPEPPKPDKPA